MEKFVIQFADNVNIQFEDVIELNTFQKEIILSYACKHTKEEINYSKSGVKIELDSDQKNKVMDVKEQIVSGKTPLELYKQQFVEFTAHSVDRVIKRYGGDKTKYYFFVINIIQNANSIYNLAEWKGFKSLTYTFLYILNHITNKVVVTFVRKGKNIKVITVMNDAEFDSLDFRISEDDQLKQKMLQLRNKLKDTYRI